MQSDTINCDHSDESQPIQLDTTTAPPAGYDLDSGGMSAFLHVKKRTLDQWAWRKINLPYALIAGKRWYRKSDGEHYLFKRQVRVTPPKSPKRNGPR